MNFDGTNFRTEVIPQEQAASNDHMEIDAVNSIPEYNGMNGT